MVARQGGQNLQIGDGGAELLAGDAAGLFGERDLRQNVVRGLRRTSGWFPPAGASRYRCPAMMLRASSRTLRNC